MKLGAVVVHNGTTTTIKTIVIFYTEILTRKVVLWSFFTSETKWKNPQFNFLSQNLSIERNFFKWDGKVTKNQDITSTLP